MKLFSPMLPSFSFWLCLLFASNFGTKTIASTLWNQTDNLALLKFKESISSDPQGILHSWNSSNHDFCKWQGITCSPMHQRVTELNLRGCQLRGSISPHVGNLSFLRILDLANNTFSGNIPQEMGRLFHLQQLLLTNNSLEGKIPANLSSCSNLQILSLRGNNLFGRIPIEFSSFQKLQILGIAKNNFTGGVPPFIGNISSLTVLLLGYNNFDGHIPREICGLKNLTNFAVHTNKLSGGFPSCLYNMSSLTIISAAENQLDGSLPLNMFNTLPNLQYFAIGSNHFSGPIPTSLVNASSISFLDFGDNQFVGQVPNLAKLKDLQLISFDTNNLGDNSTKDLDFLKSLTNCSELQVISMSWNNFGGSLPNIMGNLSTQLSQLYLGGNQISGKIPAELGNLINLNLLSMIVNHLEGTIPNTFGKFSKMNVLDFTKNKLSGDIPPFVCNFSQLFFLSLAQNMLEGDIPTTIGSCKNLQYLDLSQNNLRGTIPLEVFTLSSLTILLDLSHNSFSGSLSQEISMLKTLGILNVSENHLSGDIPTAIGECASLEYLHLQGNSFQGIIPSSLASLKGLRRLDLSRNNLSGSIPKGLQNVSFLEYFNVSFNMLEGEVPTEGVFHNASEVAVSGNNNLCGGIPNLHLPACPVKDLKPVNHRNFRWLIIVIASVVVFLLILLLFYFKRKRNKKQSFDSPTIDQLAKVSYQNLYKGTDGFSASNFIGSGNFGSVYKGTLESEDRVVAIKVLNLQKKGAHKSFVAECNALKNIRHRNLVKILTCCSSTDYKSQEFKALVFEYMSNGSLENWLHPTAETTDQHNTLNLKQRLNIITDVASAFHYLHCECEQPIIHCDLKPSNVLLDDCMVAHVSDFGLARLLSNVGVSRMQSSTIGIKGTVGYAPPEYGMSSEVSIEGDMYSFGILLLEMLTGKRPTDEMFKDGHNLHSYVRVSIPHHIFHILDPTILRTGLEQNIENGYLGVMHPNTEKCLLSLFRIAIACSVESPKERMSMADVTRELNIIKNFFPNGV